MTKQLHAATITSKRMTLCSSSQDFSAREFLKINNNWWNSRKFAWHWHVCLFLNPSGLKRAFMNSKSVAALEVPGTLCTTFDSKNSSDARRPCLQIHHRYALNHSPTLASTALKLLHKMVKIPPFYYGRAPSGSDKHNALSSWCKVKKISPHPVATLKTTHCRVIDVSLILSNVKISP